MLHGLSDIPKSHRGQVYLNLLSPCKMVSDPKMVHMWAMILDIVEVEVELKGKHLQLQREYHLIPNFPY